ncbi:MAG: GGDEF domain-containing protein, partial [Clostridia bacterium]|nr:GGDEF domain-containing protein [Clostridia bacterium]
MNKSTELVQKFIKEIFFFILAALVLGVGFIGVQIKHKNINSEAVNWVPEGREIELVPDNFKQVDERTREFTFSNIYENSNGNCFAFFSVHQNVDVYADGMLIYQIQGGKLGIGRTTGTRWNFVSIPNGTKDMMVRYTSIYAGGGKNEAKYKGVFYLGNGAALYTSMLKKSLLSFELSIIMMSVAVILFAFWLFARKPMDIENTLAYYCLFTFFVGLWTLCETPLFSSLTFPELASAITYITISVLPVLFIQFIRSFLDYRDKYFNLVVCGFNIIGTITILILLFTKTMDLKESAFITHGLFIVDAIYVFTAVGGSIRKHRLTSDFLVRMVCTFIIVFTLFLNVIFYYLDKSTFNAWSGICFISVIAIYSTSLIIRDIKAYNEKTKIAFYKEAAFHDYMTGLWNRNAFSEDLKKVPSLNEVSVVIFDLNHVKPVNDKFGHDIGDRYIIAAAHLIEGVFSAHGKCYRIGGDEFCCVIKKTEKCNINSLVEQL